MIAQKIFSEKIINQLARKDIVWNQISDFSRLKDNIPGIDKIAVNKTDKENELKTEWFVTIDGAPFTWLEIDNLNRNTLSILFESVSGDFDCWNGKWSIEKASDGSLKIVCSLNYKLGIPILEDIVGNVLHQKIQNFIEKILTAHCDLIDKSVCEERHYRRVFIGKNIAFLADNRKVDAEIKDFSCGGFLFKLNKGMIQFDSKNVVKFSFDKIVIEGRCDYDEKTKLFRVKFLKVLSLSDFNSILSQWETGLELSEDMIKIYDVLTTKTDIHKHELLKTKNTK